jgi:hypothetical protein
MGASFRRRSSFGCAFAAVAGATTFATVSLAGQARPADGRGSPVTFLERVVRQIAANDYRDAWQTLAPEQQRLIPETEYVRCESGSPIPGRLVSMQVLRSYTEPVVVAGAGSSAVAARAVMLRLRIADPRLGSVVVTHAVHAVVARSRWAWILPPDRFRLHRSGRCGTGAR